MGKKFLKVCAKDIEKNTFLLNGSTYLYNESCLLSDIFMIHKVPEEYHYVFFGKSFFGDCIREIILSIPFDIKNTQVGNIRARLIKKSNREIYLYYLNCKEANSDKNKAIDFYFSLYKNGYIKDYLDSLNEFFQLNLDLNYINEISESNYLILKKRKKYNEK